MRWVIQTWYAAPRCGIEYMDSSPACWALDLFSSGTGGDFAVPTGHGGMPPRSGRIHPAGHLQVSGADHSFTTGRGPGRYAAFEAFQAGFFLSDPLRVHRKAASSPHRAVFCPDALQGLVNGLGSTVFCFLWGKRLKCIVYSGLRRFIALCAYIFRRIRART